MPANTLTAGTVMDQAAALMNDAAKAIYSYVVQIPYLNMSLQELQEYFELNNVPVTDTVTADVIEVLAGQSEIGYEPTPTVPATPYLPDDLIEPKVVWESEAGQNNWTIMQRLDFLPRYEEGIEIPQFLNYTWQSQEIRFIPANQDNDIKIDYTRNLFTAVTDSDDELGVVNAASFLEYRTAALLAEFVGENPSRAASLNQDCMTALDRALGIGTKGRQAINIRHRPFRAGYKRRTWGF